FVHDRSGDRAALARALRAGRPFRPPGRGRHRRLRGICGWQPLPAPDRQGGAAREVREPDPPGRLAPGDDPAAGRSPPGPVGRPVWEGWLGGGGVVVYGNGGRRSVWFANYADLLDLAAFFRSALPAEVQERYERFEAACVPTSAAFRRSHDRQDRCFIALLPVTALALLVLALWDPWDLCPWRAAPLAFTLLMGVRALSAPCHARQDPRTPDP